MRIAIEATHAQKRVLTGFGHYVANLIRALGRVAPENEYLLLHSSETWRGPDFGPQFKPLSYYTKRTPLGSLLQLNSLLKKKKADIYHATCTIGVPPSPEIPCVATIHDIYPILYPHECFSPPSSTYRLFLQFTVEGSRHFIVNSDFTASEFASEYPVARNDMTTAYLAPAQDERLLCWPQGRPQNSYILCAGAIERRKGQLIFMEAYRRVADRLGRKMPDLLFVGPDRGDGEQLARMIYAFDLSDKVQWLRYVSNYAMAAYFRSASYFAMPSTYEGFGMPLIEAMAAGIPTLCSDIPVFREIAGSYPAYAAPDPKSMADTLEKMLNGAFNKQFETAPRPNYSWDENARITLGCYSKALR